MRKERKRGKAAAVSNVSGFFLRQGFLGGGDGGGGGGDDGGGSGGGGGGGGNGGSGGGRLRVGRLLFQIFSTPPLSDVPQTPQLSNVA